MSRGTAGPAAIFFKRGKAMLNLFETPVEESAWFDFPWNPEVRFRIVRSGISGFQKEVVAQQGRSMMGAMREQLKKEGTTVAQAMQGELDLEEVLKKIPVSDIELSEVLSGMRPEAVARYLVAEVTGLKDIDSGKPQKWTVEKGALVLADHPHITTWVVEQANELEEKYQAMVEVSAKNSPASSDAPDSEEAVEIDS